MLLALEKPAGIGETAWPQLGDVMLLLASSLLSTCKWMTLLTVDVLPHVDRKPEQSVEFFESLSSVGSVGSAISAGGDGFHEDEGRRIIAWVDTDLYVISKNSAVPAVPEILDNLAGPKIPRLSALGG